jgi:hypothetical protein
MELSKRPSSYFFGAALLGPLMLAGCVDPEPANYSFTGATSVPFTTTVTTTAENDTEEDESGMTSDPSDESAETTGDGDGDGDGDVGDGDGDGDGDAGDGDGDTDGIGCSDGDSGAPPLDNDDVFAPAEEEPEPHGGFVPMDDLPPISECDIFMQNCPLGEKCVPYAANGGSWDADKCVPVLGNGMVGEACMYGGIVEATDDCDETSACWDVMDVNGEAIGTCAAFCMGTSDAPICPVGTSCLQGNDSLAFCVEGCNPLTQECPNGEACFWATDAFNCIFTTEDVPTGQPCGYINDCAEGNSCITGSLVPNCLGAACCASFCDLDCGLGLCPQPGTECVPFFENGQAPIGSADIGVCLEV